MIYILFYTLQLAHDSDVLKSVPKWLVPGALGGRRAWAARFVYGGQSRAEPRRAGRRARTLDPVHGRSITGRLFRRIIPRTVRAASSFARAGARSRDVS